MIIKEDLRFLLSSTLDPLAPFTNKLATIDKPSSCHVDRRKSKIGRRRSHYCLVYWQRVQGRFLWRYRAGFSLFVHVQFFITPNKKWNRYDQLNHHCLHIMISDREYWMLYSEPGFLVVVWFGSSPHSTPSSGSPSPVRKLDRRRTGRLRKIDNLLTGQVGEGWRAGRIQIIRRREALVHYKSFSTLWFQRYSGEKNDQSIKPLFLTGVSAA